MMNGSRKNQLFESLCCYGRAGIPEVTVAASWFFAEGGNVLVGSGDSVAAERFCLRSLAKPWQFLAIAREDFDPRWLIAVASHSGEAQHEELVAALGRENGFDVHGICCPASYPMDDALACGMKVAKREKLKILHPCSGKHAHFLFHALTCSGQGGGLAYSHPEHPLQAKVRAFLEAQGVVASWVTDSCGLPTPIVSGADVASLWWTLAADQSASAKALVRLWCEHPHVVGGTDRLDTMITAVGRGQLIAKEGADGLLMVQSLGENGQSVFIKLAAGYHKNFLALALLGVLRRQKGSLNRALASLYAKLSENASAWHPADQPLMWL